jgi:hypothetical protein
MLKAVRDQGGAPRCLLGATPLTTPCVQWSKKRCGAKEPPANNPQSSGPTPVVPDKTDR